MNRRQLLKSGALAGVAAAVPAVGLAAAGEPITFAPMGWGSFVRYWRVLAPVPALGLVPGVHKLHEWTPTHALAAWRIGDHDGTNGTAIVGNAWPIVLRAYVAGALRPMADIDTGEADAWSPDHAGLIAAHGPERALVLASAEYERRSYAKYVEAVARYAALKGAK